MLKSKWESPDIIVVVCSLDNITVFHVRPPFILTWDGILIVSNKKNLHEIGWLETQRNITHIHFLPSDTKPGAITLSESGQRLSGFVCKEVQELPGEEQPCGGHLVVVTRLMDV